MMMERYSHSDRIYLIVFAILALFSAFILINDQIIRNWSYHGIAFQTPLGKILEKENDVRQKMVNSPAWNTANSGETVHDKQMVFTGDNSSTLIVLDSGTELNLGANTLVMISKDQDLDQIELLKGEVKGNFKKAKVKYQNKEIKMDNKLSTVKIQDKKITLNKIDTTNLAPSETKSVIRNAISQAPVVKVIQRNLDLIKKPTSKYYIGSNTIAVPLQWKPENVSAPYTVTITRRSGNRVKVANVKVKQGTEYTLKIKKAGDYSVYVKGNDPNRTRTESVDFKIKSVLDEKLKLKKDLIKVKL
jgi:hypothetical protein